MERCEAREGTGLGGSRQEALAGGSHLFLEPTVRGHCPVPQVGGGMAWVARFGLPCAGTGYLAAAAALPVT